MNTILPCVFILNSTLMHSRKSQDHTIADDMVDGSCCQLCGQYFKDPNDQSLYTHGYPVVCWECWDDLAPNERTDYQKATVKTLGWE
jgi:hypothetical protein